MYLLCGTDLAFHMFGTSLFIIILGMATVVRDIKDNLERNQDNL